MNKRRVVIDFDNTLHSYTSGWQGANVANDPPHKGAIEWLRTLLEHPEIEPMIYSSRSCQEGGVLCMKEWLVKHGMTAEEADRIGFPTQKPEYTFLTIDDRAIRFEGTYWEADEILNYQPFNSQWPRWTRYAQDEAGKYGIKVRLPKRPDGLSVELYTDDGQHEVVRIAVGRSHMHYSIVEPDVRFQVRVIAVNFQREWDRKAGRQARPFCQEHQCHHMPNEPRCEWEQKLGHATWKNTARDEAAKHGLEVEDLSNWQDKTINPNNPMDSAGEAIALIKDGARKTVGISYAKLTMMGGNYDDEIRRTVRLKAMEFDRDKGVSK